MKSESEEKGCTQLSPPSDEVIPVAGDDGQIYNFKVLQRFQFEEKGYVLLLNISEMNFEVEDDEELPIMLMRETIRGEQAVFSHIEDDSEIERVAQYVEELFATLAEGHDACCHENVHCQEES